ncbi:uncharacterized protein LOC129598972 [Paramacrobiotus metropolitanus]|uniref:uncharacterized protein LOC129598972 n=1 Tax=Paramacrobiotus metropolitanus TaxID=2943436 RepID=UPI002445BAF2|nr:uncharacterized protein LOC129598972 [Paramacrobiotus metropolitanus]
MRISTRELTLIAGIKTIKIDKLLILVEQAIRWCAEDVMKKFLGWVDNNAGRVLVSDELITVSLATLIIILLRSTLHAEENDVYLAVERWAVEACKRDNMGPSPANRRQVLGDALFLVRFPLLDPGQLADGPAKSGLLTEAELASLFLYRNATTKPKLPFPTERRQDRLMRVGFLPGQEVFVESPAGFWWEPAKITGTTPFSVTFTWCTSRREDSASADKVVRAAHILFHGQCLHALTEKGYYRYSTYQRNMWTEGLHVVSCNRKEMAVRFDELMLQDSEVSAWNTVRRLVLVDEEACWNGVLLVNH